MKLMKKLMRALSQISCKHSWVTVIPAHGNIDMNLRKCTKCQCKQFKISDEEGFYGWFNITN